MGAAAQFLAECIDLNNPHLVAVLVAEKGQRALLNRFSNPHDLRSDRVIEPYPFVDESLDFLKLYRAHRREMSEVEPQTVRRDQRAILLDMRAEDLAKCRMEQVGSRMIARGRQSERQIQARLYEVSLPDSSPRHNPLMDEHLRNRLDRLFDLDGTFRPCQDTLISSLTAALCVKWRPIEDHFHFIALHRILRHPFLRDNGQHSRLRGELLIA